MGEGGQVLIWKSHKQRLKNILSLISEEEELLVLFPRQRSRSMISSKRRKMILLLILLLLPCVLYRTLSTLYLICCSA